MSIAQFIDHTILKPTATLGDIEKVCDEASVYGFAAVCIPPYYVRDAAQILAGSISRVATVIGFPFGYSHYEAKAAEASTAIEDGAKELDMVMNIAAFKSNDLAWLESEIELITGLVKDKDIVIKVIIESGVLHQEEIIKCCALYQHYPVDFLKTSTGYAESGASVEAVRIMRQHLPAHIGIKASGGIRNFAFAQQLIDAGATRLGCSASVAIVKGEGSNEEEMGAKSGSGRY
ncbi:MAG TPA: deoxyribose-phosphate aldolase [Flavisolibacter sp.]|nr:deoxyribose-phosphate aldolase [Flavisolibacter sp.]